ncbi:MAG: YlbF family regulator [Actinobacteria bacterium]|nr:YlbF family regulator [Actinomycetota bacterium]
MSILEKARELGEEIASSPELQQMKEAEIAMMNDTQATDLVEEFNRKQRKYLDLKAQGADLDNEQVKETEDLEKKVMGNRLIVDFFRKQQNFERIIEQINEIISDAIAGGHGCSDGCSDDCCSSCSGCGEH